MTDLIVVPQTTEWHRLKALVLDGVFSPITRRVYNLGLDEFIAWYGLEPRPGFTKVSEKVVWQLLQGYAAAAGGGRPAPCVATGAPDVTLRRAPVRAIGVK